MTHKTQNQPLNKRHTLAGMSRSPAFPLPTFGVDPFSLLACAACFGKTDDRLAQGMNAGILTLLGIILAVLFGVAAFFVYVARRHAGRAAQGPLEKQN